MKDEKAIEEFKQDRNALATAETSSTRAMAEVQAAMVVAKRFPRDRVAAFASIIEACSRPAFASLAMYSYPRGDAKVTGPSIRLAEVMAQSWGNIDFGVVELETRPGESTMMSYCWDLETNTRRTATFTVQHQRKARGAVIRLEDPRDIYEMNANLAARRLRSCILAVIPRDVQDAAVMQVKKAVAKGDGMAPLVDRVRNLVVAFARQSVTKAQLETYLGHSVETTTGDEFADLQAIWQAIHDGMGKPVDYFAAEPTAAERSQNGKPKTLDDLIEKPTVDEELRAAQEKLEKRRAEAVDDPSPEELREDELRLAGSDEKPKPRRK